MHPGPMLGAPTGIERSREYISVPTGRVLFAVTPIGSARSSLTSALEASVYEQRRDKVVGRGEVVGQHDRP